MSQTFTPQPIKDRKFENETVRIDGYRFENCEFKNCTLLYAGGFADSSNCFFHPDTQWGFEGAAGILMDVLPRFAWRFSFGNGSPEDVIRFPADAT